MIPAGMTPKGGVVAAELLTRARRIRLLVSDVDGCWTDGRIWIDADGRQQVAFHVHDGLGVQRLRAAGVEVCLISGRDNPAVAARARALGLTEVFLGIDDKAGCVQQVLERLGLEAQQVAAFGDDLPDLELFAAAALRCAPANAVAAVNKAADLVTSRRGGHGALRELCDWLLNVQGVPSQ